MRQESARMNMKWGLALMLSHSCESLDRVLKKIPSHWHFSLTFVLENANWGVTSQCWNSCFQSVPAQTEVAQQLEGSTWFPHEGHLYHLSCPAVSGNTTLRSPGHFCRYRFQWCICDKAPCIHWVSVQIPQKIQRTSVADSQMEVSHNK